MSDAHGRLIAVRAFFPSSLNAAIRQKARWMTGIALAGWDRIGWGHWWQLAEHWMRMRDRRAPFAVIVLVAAYAAIVGWAVSLAVHALRDTIAPALGDTLQRVLMINLLVLVWRLAWRIASTSRSYGWREGLWAVPRAVVGNLIGMVAAMHAIASYAHILAGHAPRWDKTVHVFPDRPDELAPR